MLYFRFEQSLGLILLAFLKFVHSFNLKIYS